MTARQLATWSQRGLIPSVVRRPLGRGKGSTTLGYPATALANGFAIKALLHMKRDLDWVAGGLWLAGFEVRPSTVRRSLRRLLVRWKWTWHTYDRWVARESEDDSPLSLKARRNLGAWGTPRLAEEEPHMFRQRTTNRWETVVAVLAPVFLGQRLRIDGLHWKQQEDTMEPLRRAWSALFERYTRRPFLGPLDGVIRGLCEVIRQECSADQLLARFDRLDAAALSVLREEFAAACAMGWLVTKREHLLVIPPCWFFLGWFACRETQLRRFVDPIVLLPVEGREVRIRDLAMDAQRMWSAWLIPWDGLKDLAHAIANA